MNRLALRIVGRVQGVGFRWFVTKEARRLGLLGFVRNNPDGSVEVVADGLPEDLEQMERLCRQGPRGARVERVERLSSPSVEQSFTTFEVR